MVDAFRIEGWPMNGPDTTCKSLSLRRAAFSLALVGAGVVALYQFVIVTIDVQLVATAEADAQATANAAAAGSLADLPNGPIAVIRKAGQIIASRKATSQAARFGDTEIQIGHWDAASRTFAAVPGKPNAVRTTVRVRNLSGLLGTGLSGRQIEAQAIAVQKTAGAALLATKGVSSTAN
jgi:hypothetical protein